LVVQEIVAEFVVMPEAAIKESVGAVTSFETVTVTEGAVPRFPAASRADAEML